MPALGLASMYLLQLLLILLHLELTCHICAVTICDSICVVCGFQTTLWVYQLLMHLSFTTQYSL